MSPRLIAGLFPEPLGDMSREDRQAIDDRKALIEARARALAEEAITNGEAWVRRLGEQPTGHGDRDSWIRAATTVAAYRDRYKVRGDLPLGGGATTDAQRAERQRAFREVREAFGLSAGDRPARRAAAAIRAISTP